MRIPEEMSGPVRLGFFFKKYHLLRLLTFVTAHISERDEIIQSRFGVSIIQKSELWQKISELLKNFSQKG